MSKLRDAQCKNVLCAHCSSRGDIALAVLAERRRLLERRREAALRRCMQCSRTHQRQVECQSLDCAQLFTRLKLERQLGAAHAHCLRAVDDIRGSLAW